MLIEYCLVGFKKTFPPSGCVRRQGERDTDGDSEEGRKTEIARRAGGKQRDHAHMSHIPMRSGEKFWGGSQEALTLER